MLIVLLLYYSIIQLHCSYRNKLNNFKTLHGEILIMCHALFYTANNGQQGFFIYCQIRCIFLCFVLQTFLKWVKLLFDCTNYRPQGYVYQIMILGYTINNKHVTVQESYIKNVLCIAISDLLILLYSDNLVSFHTGLISRPGNDPINPEQVEDISV